MYSSYKMIKIKRKIEKRNKGKKNKIDKYKKNNIIKKFLFFKKI